MRESFQSRGTPCGAATKTIAPVCGFAVDNEELYVELEYESGGVRMVPARDLYTEALFEAFCKLVGKI